MTQWMKFVSRVIGWGVKTTRRLQSLLLLLFLFSPVLGKDFSAVNLADKIVAEYDRLEALNDKNDAAGRSGLNDFLIRIDNNDPWIELRPASVSVEGIGFDYFNTILRSFNNGRHDNLRFYVVVLADYPLQLNAGVDVTDFKKSLDFFMYYKAHGNGAGAKIEDWLKYKVDSVDWQIKLRALKKDVINVPKEISKNLESRGFTDRVIYFYGILNFFTTQNKRQYVSFDNLLIEGNIKSKRDKIIQIAKAGILINGSDHGGYDIAESYRAGMQIDKAIKSITNAIRMYIDKDNLLLPDLSLVPADKRGLWINPDTLSATRPQPDETKNVLYEDGNLYTYISGQKTSYTQSQSVYMQKVVRALNDIRSTSEGKEMVKALQDSWYNVIIYHTSFNEYSTNKLWSRFYPTNALAAAVISHYDQLMFETHTRGSGGKLYWHPKPMPYETNSVLLHELFHSWDALRGLIDKRNFDARYDIAEARAIYFQDIFRNKMGQVMIENFSQPIPVPVIKWLQN